MNAFLDSLPQTSIRLSLGRVEAALAALGNPQGRYPGILVAGTNGKGSTCAFLSAALQANGRKVGLATSPHLVSFRERIRIDGLPISEEALEGLIDRLRDAYPPSRDPTHPDALTYFEVGVVLAFLAFAEAGVDMAVIEVGLGGRLDATNVPGTDLRATVVTRIGLDHQDFLGDTLEAIAREKGAIARPGIPLILGPQEEPARQALLGIAREKGAVPVEAGAVVPGGPLGLLGSYQRENASVALATLEAIGCLDPVKIGEGFARARWPGRLEVVGEGPLVILDGAHNPAGARALAQALAGEWQGIRPRIVFGMLSDKDRAGVMEAILPLGAAIHVCTPESPRAVPARKLAEEAEVLLGGRVPVHCHGRVAEALEAARTEAGPDGAVLICGSLYLVGEARALLCGEGPAV